MVKTVCFIVETKGKNEIINITGDIEKSIHKSGVKNGIVCVFIPGATAGISTMEFEDGLIRDFKRYWEKSVPQDMDYAHDLKWHDKNGHSHIRASVLGSSLTIPFNDTKLLTGTWQQIILVDFDVRNRERDVICQIIGE